MHLIILLKSRKGNHANFVDLCQNMIIEDLPKCHLDDSECLRDLYEMVIKEIIENGLPEQDVPPMEPMVIENVTFNIHEVANLTIVEGMAKGIKECIVEKFSINITAGIGHQENTCDISVEGHYIMEAFSPLFKNFLGEEYMHGNGYGKSETENMHLIFDFPFNVIQHDDGEIYIKCIYDLIKYDYENREKVVYAADNIVVGDEDISELMVEMMNENWRIVMSTCAPPFMDKSVESYFKFVGFFFDSVPARHYIIEDLSPYLKP
ncbi:hypothetical protein B5X24_HaOG204350 [Helicoverpa armigera]|uniref:Uncharacterized protein n=1 Tax=Helicoverpa armigera TaxID=29058 RepID=A0A2W1BTZ4_HELAM|nr:hypothetical protein B5X24_HaOG204350 [Helicoverpa armigera]